MKKEKVCACNDEKCTCDKKKNLLVIAVITLAVLLVVAVGFIVYPMIKSAGYLGKWEHNVTFDNGGTPMSYYESITFNKNHTFDYTSKAEGENDQSISGKYVVVGNDIYLNIENENAVSSTYAVIKDGKFCLGEKDCKTYFVKEKSKISKDIDLTQKEETTTTANKVEKNEKAINLYVFHGETCPHCKELLAWIDTLEADAEYGAMFKLVKYEVWNDTNNSALMGKVAKKLNVDASGVPFVVIGDKTFTGYAESMNEEIKAAIKDQFNNKKYKDIVANIKK